MQKSRKFPEFSRHPKKSVKLQRYALIKQNWRYFPSNYNIKNKKVISRFFPLQLGIFCWRVIKKERLTTWFSSLSILNPSLSSKVGRFGNIESVIESRMVRVRKYYNNFPFLLMHFLVGYPVLVQNFGV